jgi:hypothetical protein
MNWGPMVKALSALAISAFMAVALFVLPGVAPRVDAGGPVSLQEGGRLHVRIIDKDCTNQTWPNFSASCLYGESAKLEPRRVGADRG